MAATPISATAGAWDRELGSAYLKLGFNMFTSEQSFRQGIAMDLGFQSWTTNLYAEIGLPMRLSLVADVPYVIATNLTPSGTRYTNHTVGDGRFELDFQLLPSPLIHLFELPTSIFPHMDFQQVEISMHIPMAELNTRLSLYQYRTFPFLYN